ncbi:MAG TPA: hypothetical protein PLF51_07945, partial [Candidatus Hydrogenedentes bacterium]|nr:hypothetical protein [Candidatus Hydrogenedentota bacterium]
MKYAMVTIFGAAMLFTVAAVPAFAGEEQAPLKIELPEKSFMGTPLDYWSENLEFTYKARDPFMAPVGTVLRGEKLKKAKSQPQRECLFFG